MLELTTTLFISVITAIQQQWTHKTNQRWFETWLLFDVFT